MDNDFLLHQIRQEVLYENREVLSSMEALSLPERGREAIGELPFPKIERGPYLYSSMVSSIDGRMGFTDDPIGPLISRNNILDPNKGKADFWFLNLLRASSHLVILGAKTLQVERDAMAFIFDRELVSQREAMHIEEEQPINLILSLTGEDLPLDHPLLYSKEVKVIIATSPKGTSYLRENLPVPSYLLKEGEKYRREGEVDILCTGKESTTSIKGILEILGSWGLKRVLVESPSFTWQLLQRGLLHEIFLTYSTLLAGGDVIPGLSQPFKAKDHPHTRLLRLARHGEGLLFTRLQVLYGEEGESWTKE